MTTALNIETLELAEGGHSSPDAGLCFMEAVAFVAREPHSDHPVCVSSLLGPFGRSLNDILPDDKRQKLKPLIPAIIGTASDGQDYERGLMAADWIIRVYTPTWLRLAGIEEQAVALETLPRQATWDDVEAAVGPLQEARKKAVAARDAAGAAARAAARAAAWDAARAAAGDAAWAAAGDALQPTVDALQDSAIELFERMVTIGNEETA